MITECLQVFQKVLEKDENVILREYIPADGTYVLVDKNYQIKGEPVEIKMDKKTGIIDKSSEYYNEICFYDYHSKLISMNKPLDPRKVIHSNNYYSFWVKKESIVNGKLTEEVIDQYYEILEEPGKKYDKGKVLELYQAVEESLGSVKQDILKKNKAWIKEHIFSIKEFISVDLEKKDYLKIFFEAETSEYEKEGKRYFIPNIYNSNDYNIKIEDKVLGLPDNNLNMNSKKPFLANKTRKVPTPYLLDENQVMLQKQLFDYFMNFVSAGKYNVYVDLERNEFLPCRNDDKNKGFPPGSVCGFFPRLQKGKNEAEIHYQDVVPFYEDKLETELEFIDYMKIPNKKHPEYAMEYRNYSKFSEVERLIDDIFFSKMLRNNYFTEPEKLSITEEGLKRNLLLYRMKLFSWLRLNHKDGVKKVVEEAFLEMIKSSILNGHSGKAVRQINLRLSLLRYFSKGGEYMADFSVSLRENLKQKMVSEESRGLENDTEYYYAVGQLARYYIFLNRGAKKNESLINPILNAKNSKAIKEKLLQYYKKYNYDIVLGAKKADMLYKLILGYEAEGKVQQDMICMGFVDNNLVLEKKEEKKDE